MSAGIIERPIDGYVGAPLVEAPMSHAEDVALIGRSALLGSASERPRSALLSRAVGAVLEQSLRTPSPTGDINIGGVTAFDSYAG